MASFRALPPSPRGVVRTQQTGVDAKRIHVPVARAMVDCGVYVDGARLPGKYTHAAALEKVHELEAAARRPSSGSACTSPTTTRCGRGRRVRSARTGRRGRRARPPAAEAGTLRQHAVPGAQDGQLRRARSVALAREIVETGEIMMFVGADFVVTVRHGEHTGLAGVRKQLETRPSS